MDPHDGADASTTGWTSGGVRFHARIDRPAAAHARLYLVHGLGDHSGRHDRLVSGLVARGIASARFDLRGHGRSGGKRGDAPSVDVLLDDVEEFLAHADTALPPVPRFLYGHSLGGLLALLLLVRRGFDGAGAIASSPALRPASDPPAWKLALARVLVRIWPSATLANGLDLGGVSREPEVGRQLRGDALAHRRVSARLGLAILAEARALAGHRGALPCPVLLLHGDADRVTGFRASQEFAARHPEVEFVRFPGGYHELHNDLDRDRAVGVIEEFVRRHARAHA